MKLFWFLILIALVLLAWVVGSYAVMIGSLKVRRRPKYPQPLDSFFVTGLCPQCGNSRFDQRQDGGHDVLLRCVACGARFGVQESPFEMIEKI
jgi:hypothetical protein